jgi:5-methylcytosine-specific restriction protein A
MSPKASRATQEAARRIVRDRDGDTCQMCGRFMYERRSVHHRLPKGMGGSALLESPANLVTLCGVGNADGCHGKAHSNPQWARNHGWIVSRSFDPAEIPVDMHDGWWLLTAAGERLPYTGEGAA